MDPTTAVNVPLTAWEQAVVVVLFIVFLGGVFAFVRWLLGWTSKQQQAWQAFTKGLNQEWRDWMDDQREQDRTSLCNVADAVKELGVKIDRHDEKVESRLAAAVNDVKGIRKKS